MNNSFLRSKFLISVFITLIGCISVLIINGFQIVYSTNDDFFISLFIANGEDKNIFISYFLSSPLVMLQYLFPTINVYMVSQLFFSVVAIAVINYIWIDRFTFRCGLIISIIFTALYIITATICLQWTQTSVTLCVAGMMLLLNSSLFHKGSIMIFQSILAMFLIIVSSFYRFISVNVVFLFFAVYIVFKAILECIKNTGKLSDIKNSIKGVISKYWKTVLLLLSVWIIVFTLNFLSQSILNSSTEYSTFRNYNSVRSGSVDYYRPPYENNKEFYNKLDIYSQNDLNMLGTWHGDEDFFTEAKLKSIRDFIKQPQANSVFSFRYLYELVSYKIESTTGISAPIVLVLVFIMFIASAIILFVFRNKLRIIFPILLCIGWSMFFLVFKISNVNVLVVPLAFILIICSFVFNRYNYLLNLLITFVFIALYFYLNFSRISFRTTFNIILPAFVLILFNINKDEMRIKYQCVTKKSISIVLLIMLIGLTAFSSFNVYLNEVESHRFIKRDSLINHIMDNKKFAFVCDLMSLKDVVNNYANPLMVPDWNDNIIPFFGWVVGSPYYHNSLSKNNISNLFTDMISSERIKLVLCDNETKEMYEKYYNEHYSSGEKITLMKEDKIDNYNIYRVVKN